MRKTGEESAQRTHSPFRGVRVLLPAGTQGLVSSAPPSPSFFFCLPFSLSLPAPPGCLGNQQLRKEPKCSHIPNNGKPSDNSGHKHVSSDVSHVCRFGSAYECVRPGACQPASAGATEHRRRDSSDLKICERLGRARVGVAQPAR